MNVSPFKDYVVIGDNVTIGERSVLDRVVVWKGAHIGKHVSLTDCILGSHCVIEDEVVVDRGVVLADGSVVKKGTRIGV